MPSTFSPARRLWILPDCPPAIIAAAPEGYGPGCIAVVYGGTPENQPPIEWAQGLATSWGLSPAAAATVAVRWVSAFLWTAYYDPAGAVAPAPISPPA